MPEEAPPPAAVNGPPAYKSPPNTASADTTGYWTPPTPESSADQLIPSHLAMRLAALPPAVAKKPPAYRSLPDTASANTEGLEPLGTSAIPEPSADQLLP